jgi:hypothetical protein
MNILNTISIECIELEKMHKDKYFRLKGKLRYYKLPVIVLSTVNSVLSAGLGEYVKNQTTISTMSSGLALACSIISSIELYLQIEVSMVRSIESSKMYKTLYLRIEKYNGLYKCHRQMTPNEFLLDIYAEFVQLYQTSRLIMESSIAKFRTNVNNDIAKKYKRDKKDGTKHKKFMKASAHDNSNRTMIIGLKQLNNPYSIIDDHKFPQRYSYDV